MTLVPEQHPCSLWEEQASPGYPCLWWPVEQDYLKMLISCREFSSLFHVLLCCMPVSMDSLVPWLEGIGLAANPRKEIQKGILTTHQSWTSALNKCLWHKLKNHLLISWPILPWQTFATTGQEKEGKSGQCFPWPGCCPEDESLTQSLIVGFQSHPAVLCFSLIRHILWDTSSEVIWSNLNVSENSYTNQPSCNVTSWLCVHHRAKCPYLLVHVCACLYIWRLPQIKLAKGVLTRHCLSFIIQVGFYHFLFSSSSLHGLESATDYSVLQINEEQVFSVRVQRHFVHLTLTSLMYIQLKLSFDKY